ncbi:MAG: TonB-dependent receptor, partial [Novosphingobium sp.]
SQELRLASDFDGPVNFLLGGFYEDRKLFTSTIIVQPFGAVLTPALPATPVPANTRLPIESTNQKQESYSGFGQLIFDPTDQIQVTAGARYTHEVKNLLDYTVALGSAAGYAAGVDVTKLPDYRSGPNPRLSYNDFSPEITVTWKPATDIMLFASYKEGFKSGGFDAGYTGGAVLAPATGPDLPARTRQGRRDRPQVALRRSPGDLQPDRLLVRLLGLPGLGVRYDQPRLPTAERWHRTRPRHRGRTAL